APTKAAQRILAESLARDLGPKGVHVAYLVIDAVIDVPWQRERLPDAADDIENAPDGFGQLRAMLAGGGLQAPMGEKLGFTLVEVERGYVVFEGTPDRSVYNPLGSVHGGYAATLLDSACGIAVHSQLGAN